MDRVLPPARSAYEQAAAALAGKVRARRLELGLNQEKLAERTGLSRNQVQNIERNRNNSRDPQTGRPSPGNARLDTIFALAHALQVEVTYLVDPAATIDEHDLARR